MFAHLDTGFIVYGIFLLCVDIGVLIFTFVFAYQYIQRRREIVREKVPCNQDRTICFADAKARLKITSHFDPKNTNEGEINVELIYAGRRVGPTQIHCEGHRFIKVPIDPDQLETPFEVLCRHMNDFSLTIIVRRKIDYHFALSA